MNAPGTIRNSEKKNLITVRILSKGICLEIIIFIDYNRIYDDIKTKHFYLMNIKFLYQNISISKIINN